MKKISGLGLTILAGGVLGILLLGAGSCDDSPPPQQQQAVDTAKNRVNYQPKNDVEGKNYNARQALADNPATLLWCTAFPPTPNSKAFTVPVVGKLTSGNKRPYPTSYAYAGGNGTSYTPELPGNDAMYGTSADYRYGFDPAGNYSDWFDLPMYCSNVPTVMQKETTIIEIKAGTDPDVLDAQVEAALKVCRAKDPDPSHPCAAADALLGK